MIQAVFARMPMELYIPPDQKAAIFYNPCTPCYCATCKGPFVVACLSAPSPDLRAASDSPRPCLAERQLTAICHGNLPTLFLHLERNCAIDKKNYYRCDVFSYIYIY